MENRGGPAEPASLPQADDWRADYFNAIPEFEELARNSRKKPVQTLILRASQLDAGRLDLELTSLLNDQLMKAFSYIQPRLVSALKPEISLILDFLIFRFSVWKGNPTPGSVLMNLRYRDERKAATYHSQGPVPPSGGRTGVEGPGLSIWQRTSLGLAYVLGRYAWSRLESVAAAYQWVDQARESTSFRLWNLMQQLETAFRLASLVNFLVFLKSGKYRSLLERLVRARLVYKRVSIPRALSFEYLNRQLVWHELSELLLFALPLINVSRLKSLVFRHLPSMARKPAISEDVPTGEPESAAWCNICHKQDMTLPYEALPCQHQFCYYCLRSQTEGQPGFTCPRCGVVVEAMQRWRPKPTQQ